MPFAYQPAQAADYGLKSPHEATPARFRPVPLPTQPLSGPAQPNVDVEEPHAVPVPVGPRFKNPGKATPQEAATDIENLKTLTGYRGYGELARNMPTPLTKGQLEGTEDVRPENEITAGKVSGLMKGATTVATPLMIVGAVAQPELTVAALLGGAAGGYGAGKLADAVKSSPETKELLQQVGGLAGAMAGGGAYAGGLKAVDPTDALADLLWKRGYIEVKGQPLHIGSQGEAMAVAREMIKQNPQGFVQSIRNGYSWSRAAENVPARQNMGVAEPWNPTLLHGETAAPPAAPQPVAPAAAPTPPAAPPMHSITSEEIAEVVDKILSRPLEERPQATLAAHTLLAAEMLKQGRFTGPDGQIYLVENEKQSSHLAQKLINPEIGRRDAEAKKAANEPVPAPPPGFTLDTAAASQPPTEQAPQFQKGDRVTLPKGETGTIVNFYGKDTARVQVGGRRVPIDVTKLKAARADSENGAGAIPADESSTPAAKEALRKLQAGEELTAEEKAIGDRQKTRDAAIQALGPEDAAKLPDKDFRRWTYPRSAEQISDPKVYEELARAQVARGEDPARVRQSLEGRALLLHDNPEELLKNGHADTPEEARAMAKRNSEHNDRMNAAMKRVRALESQNEVPSSAPVSPATQPQGESGAGVGNAGQPAGRASAGESHTGRGQDVGENSAPGSLVPS